ncbi:MAG TPA: Stk1 family PASTA domain-containing Ser/Thr kinase [Jatrophihabitantaceae bacterium]|nr:Stk1 family PASTA domain-containing Ser/Thr kinase [Jatrophihabitantaceae bacterium]
MHTATADPLVGRTLEGRYRILDRIARGGMSTVYSAVDERLDRLVAVKVMSAALSADPAFTDRFSREARAAARLSHLNTVSVYDQGTDSTGGSHSVFLVMELVEGRTLRELLRERGRLEPAEAVSIMEPVLSALAAAHRAGIVHRDVKPENILLSDEGIVKVADFGLARAVEADATSTRTGLMMGTVAYCSPEQITRGHADQRSDVYAAGVVFFELLTGTPPFHGDSAMNVAYQHVHSRVPAPSSRVKGIPSEIDELIVNATDSDPASRPPDAGAFLAELADVRAELALPIVAIPPRPRTATAHRVPPLSRTTDRVAHADGATTALVRDPAGDTSLVPRQQPHGGQPSYPPPIVTPPPRKRPVSARTRRRRRALVTLILLVVAGLIAGYTGWWFASGRYARVPNVTGDTKAAAVAELRHAGYEVSSTIKQSFSEDVATGRVVGTDPAIGKRVTKGKTITLVVSKGKERFTLPSLTNDTEAQARDALAQLPIQVAAASSRRPNDTVPEGKVIGTDPPAKTKVKRNQLVTILISAGPPIVPIPAIAAGTKLADAQQKLKDAGFKTTVVEQFSDDIGKGKVISISPTGEARKFSTITITASKGPSQVVIPDIPQLTPVEDAKRTLEGLGLKVKITKAFGGRSGLVVGVDPSAGTTVDVGSTVTLSII